MYPVLIHLTVFGGKDIAEGAVDRVEACVTGTLKLSPLETTRVFLDFEGIKLPIIFEHVQEVIGLPHIAIHAQFIMCGVGCVLKHAEAAAGLDWILRAFEKGAFSPCTFAGEPILTH